MTSIQPIIFGKKWVAIVYRGNIKVRGVKFLTEDKFPLQIGIHDSPAKTKIKPHIHRLNKPLVIKTIQEVLFVIKGKIRVTFYTKKGKIISNEILNAGDSVLLVDLGHSVEFLEDSRIFEVKQGPYPGEKWAKKYFQEFEKSDSSK